MQPQTVTLVVTLVGITGTLGGVIAGHYLTRSWQREQWLLDRRSEEFRELLTTMTQCFGEIGSARSALQPKSEESILAASEISARCHMIIRNRIFIAEEMKRLNLNEEWGNLVAAYIATRDAKQFGDAYAQISNAIITSANRNP